MNRFKKHFNSFTIAGQRAIHQRVVHIVLLLFLCGSRPAASYAQFSNKEQKRVEVVAAVGVSNLRITDKAFSNQSFDGYGPTAAISVSKETGPTLQSLNITYSSVTSQSGSKSVCYGKQWGGDLYHCYRITNIDRFIIGWLGPQLRLHYQTREYVDFINANNSYEMDAALGVHVGAGCTTKGLHPVQISLDGYLPLIAVFSQTPFGFNTYSNDESRLHNVFRNVRVTSFNVFNAPQLCLAATRHLSGNWGIALSYTALLYHLNTNHEITQFQQSLLLGLARHF